VKAFELSQDCIARAFRLNDFFSWGITKQYLDYTKTVHKYIDNFVQRALAFDEKELERREKQKYVFLEQLAQATKDPIEIRDQLLSILVAGRDTTAGLLSFLFRRLASQPQIYEKLRQIVLNDFGTDESKLTFASMKDCQYLQWCMSEALRLYPSVPLNSRRSVRDTTLPRGGGPDGESPLFVPKGTEVNYSVYAMHRTKEFWGQDADEFKPERWNSKCGLMLQRVPRSSFVSTNMFKYGLNASSTETLTTAYRSEAGIRISAVQRWPKNMFRTAIRSHRGWLCHRETFTEV
jgi:cytochrome P450